MIRLKALKLYFVSFKVKVIALFHTKRWNEAMTFSVFVLVSTSFWLLLSLQEDYETWIDIPIDYSNVSSDIILDDDRPNTIRLRIKEKGSTLLRYPSSSKQTINVGNQFSDSTKQTITLTSGYIESIVNQRIEPSTTLLSFSPRKIEIGYKLREKKTVPITFEGKIRYSPGYSLSDDIKLEPSRIEIYGSKETLNNINEIKTEATNFEKANRTITKDIALNLPKGVIADIKKVKAVFPIEAFIAKEYTIPVTCNDLPSDYSLRTFPSEIRVNHTSPISKANEFVALDFELDLSFQELENNIQGTIPAILSKRPTSIKEISIQPRIIEFILERRTTLTE